MREYGCLMTKMYILILQTFNNWQMPSRFTGTDDNVEHYDPPLHLKSEAPGMKDIRRINQSKS